MSDQPEVIFDEDKKEMEKDAGRGADEKSITLAHEVLPEVLMMVPVFDRPIFPKMMGPVMIENEELIKSIKENLDASKGYLGLVMVRQHDDQAQHYPRSADEFYEVGVTAKVVKVTPPTEPGQPLHLMLQSVDRFSVQEVISKGEVFRCRVKHWYQTEFETNEELKAYSVAIIDSIKELVKLNPLFKEGLSLVLERLNTNDPGALADFSSSMTTASGKELQEILETKSIRTRIEKALILLKRETEISKLKVKIGQRIEEKLSKQQRQFFLKEQLKEIKKELGIKKEDSETEADKFEKRIEDLELTEEARERIDEELEKLKLLEPSSAEFNVTRAYLDWLTILPWGVYTEDNYDIEKASGILDEDHYGLQDVKDRILELISVGIIKGDLAGSIILLVGPPGVGKTSIGQSLARSLNRKFFRFSLGGMRDEAEIKGHRRTYIGALPGKFIQTMKTCKTANPLIMLDEVDKIGASFQGDPASALLEVLDPEQNKDFLDHYLDVRFDLSKVLFVCTANTLESIPGPLLDRMEVIRLSGYILEEKMEIARKFLLPKQLDLHGLKEDQINLPDEVLREIIDGYAREAGVRSLENNIKKILRKSVKIIVQEKKTVVDIKKDNLRDLLGRRAFSQDHVYKKPRVGVVTGLAYTSFGGATLHVEAAPVPSNGPGFKQTGQLGSVMIESSEIAYNYIRSLLKDNERAVEVFEKNLIHIHVPAGATPKDGPSAGITMACAICSLLINKPVIENIAMTGELTLSGLVMPIGGVKEKVIAAKRAGVTNLIFPAENREDFEELDSHITESINPHFVENFEDVLGICFPDSGAAP